MVRRNNRNMTLGIIGDIVEDIVVHAEAPFAAGSDTASRIVRRRGGSAANVAAAAAGSAPTRFIGCVGDDLAGRHLAASLPVVDVRLQTTDKAPTGTIVVLLDAEGERHMFPDRGANAWLGPIDPSWLDDVTVWHVTAYSLARPVTSGEIGGTTADAVTAALKDVGIEGRPARCDDVVTSIDVSSVSVIEHVGVENFQRLIDDLDPAIVFANAAEAQTLGWASAEPARRLVFIKHGAAPTLVRGPRGAWYVPTQRIDTSDTTGAGDAFAAGVLAHIANNRLTRDVLLQADEVLATALANSGHLAATTWLHHEWLAMGTVHPGHGDGSFGSSLLDNR